MTKKYQRHTTLKPIGKSIRPVCFVIGFILPLQVACATTEEFVALINGTVSLNCSGRSSLNFRWRRGDGLGVFIAGEGFSPGYVNRSHIENDASTGAQILKISNLKLDDAELYECRPLYAGELLHTTHLTVLDSEPTCDSNANDDWFVGPNTCGLDRDDMRFSCAVSYNGTAPRLQYETVNGNQNFNDTECDKNKNPKRINCTLTLKAEPQYNGSDFRCKVITSHSGQYRCTTKVIKVHYFTPEEHASTPVHKAIGNEISCSVNSTLKLNFSWVREENNTKDVVSINRSYAINKEGLYYCNVSYIIKDASCSDVVSVVQANHTENLPETDNGSKNDLGVGLGVGIGASVAVVGAGAGVYKARAAREKKRNPNSDLSREGTEAAQEEKVKLKE